MLFRFADYVLDIDRRELLRNAEPISVEPQVFDLLVYLIENRDRVVTKDDLLDAVWAGRIVSESTLTSRINAARKAVGDSGDAQQLIRTVPRKGLRFVAQILEDAPPPPILPTPTQSSRPSIAVMPFESLTADAGQDYFADGMVAEITTGLSRIKWLLVISHNSTMTYRGRTVERRIVGQELGVRYLLDGSVSRSGNQIRLTGELIDTETSALVWSDHYDGTLDDIFALQDQMTMHVIGAVEPNLRRAEIERARRRRPDSQDAYDLYLRALPYAALAMPGDADRALVLLEDAVRLEPDYAAAHGYLAWCHEQRYLRGGLHPEVRETALHHARRAIETGADDALALAVGGFVVGAMARDYESALEALDRSLALSPSSATAFGFSSLIRSWSGDYARSIEHGLMGIRLSPYDPLIYLPSTGLAYTYYFSGQYQPALAAAVRASASNPRFSVPRYLQAASAHRLGRIEDAQEQARILMELQPGFTVSGLVAGGITAVERMELLAAALREIGLPE